MKLTRPLHSIPRILFSIILKRLSTEQFRLFQFVEIPKIRTPCHLDARLSIGACTTITCIEELLDFVLRLYVLLYLATRKVYLIAKVWPLVLDNVFDRDVGA